MAAAVQGVDSAWPEVDIVLSENRCELVLSGSEISKRIEEEGLHKKIFKLTKLNYLEISKTSLNDLPTDIQRLNRLTTLSLHSNQLTTVPAAIVHLVELKHLDLSRNLITELPEEVGQFEQLQTLNLDSNKLTALPESVKNLTKLLVLDISHNSFDDFPEFILESSLVHLSELRARGNRIGNLPAALSDLPSLKILDVVDNVVKDVAGELGDSAKLKEVHLGGNPLKDRRLLKMVEQCHHKQIIDYIRANCKREMKAVDNDPKSKSKKNKKKKGKGDADDMEKVLDSIRVLYLGPEPVVVQVMDAVKDIRPYIVCCILRGVNLQEAVNFKSFISLQTRLHENICKNRTVATIATHDLSKIKGDLVYTARVPNGISITPLQGNKAVSALGLFQQLQRDAEQLRKEKKRNTYSGVHKYIYLMEGKPLFPCLLDSDGQVISLPPITNSGITKISSETKDVLIEVTGSSSLSSVKEVLEAFIKEVLSLDLYKEELNDGGVCRLVLQQVKIVDKELNLKVLYPSHPDLDFHDIKIVRVE
ncbi:hypothetical protein CHUAL_004455 [Chamberlinius hualienensis]